jgi:outer membrane lipoprotein-sorting protein
VEKMMINFIAGIVVGFFVATYGVSGVATALDKGITAVKQINVTVEQK